jgi:surface protein
LIELLAVILILGIIALIAIPTVNKILDEAREGAFRTGSDNVMKAIETKCQTSIIKGEIPNKTYVFTNGEINSSIEIKGTLPNNGYIILDSECAIEEFYLTQNKYVYSNVSEENYKNNYMLKAPINSEESIFKTLYSSYYNNLLSINFVNHLNIPENAIEIKDPSVSQKGKIKSWLVPNDTKYDLFVGSLNKIYANYDSSYLFFQSYAETLDTSNLYTDLTSIFYKSFSETKFKSLNLNNLNTSNANNMMSMFANSENLMMLEISNFKTNNVNNSQYMFYNCNVLENLDLSLWDTSNITDMRYMFYGCNSSKKINSGNWDTSNVKSFIHMFNGCYDLKLEVSEWNTSNVESIGYMFVSCSNNNVLDLSK